MNFGEERLDLNIVGCTWGSNGQPVRFSGQTRQEAGRVRRAMGQRVEPVIEGGDPLSRRVRGTFYRAVDPAYREFALAGSRAAGRYSPPGVPTLYLSSSPEWVVAAMIAHADHRAPDLKVLKFDVEAAGISDLRDPMTLAGLGIDPGDAAADWQVAVAAGRVPPSWVVREALEHHGARGLIDPSCKRPGLWHLTLFSWNRDGVPAVRDSSASHCGTSGAHAPGWADLLSRND
jgi:RES domain-containing protein